MTKFISKYPYKVQNVGFPTTGVKETQWKDLSFHTSKLAAFKAVWKYREHLQPDQWDDHYRIINRKINKVARLTDAEFHGHWS